MTDCRSFASSRLVSLTCLTRGAVGAAAGSIRKFEDISGCKGIGVTATAAVTAGAVTASAVTASAVTAGAVAVFTVLLAGAGSSGLENSMAGTATSALSGMGRGGREDSLSGTSAGLCWVYRPAITPTINAGIAMRRATWTYRPFDGSLVRRPLSRAGTGSTDSRSAFSAPIVLRY
ncbi:MAG: hypothetical protein JRJ37_10485 [Deltaproteobacteria bacterium]|nr:hypothetical protein [Deltaproteobacteria bacterium]